MIMVVVVDVFLRFPRDGQTKTSLILFGSG